MRPKPSRFRVAALAFVLLFAAGNASADLLSAIAALSPGDQYRVVFDTSTFTLATSSNISYYNTFVQDAADAGSVTGMLGLSWTAVASTAAVNAQVNTGLFRTDNSPLTVFNTAGGTVATSGAGFWNAFHSAAMVYDENGVPSSQFGVTWTGTNYSGSTLTLPTFSGAEVPAPLGSGASSPGEAAILGPFAGGLWATGAASIPTQSAAFSIYGMSATVTVPTPSAPAPEPSTLTLSALALLALVGGRRKRAPAE